MKSGNLKFLEPSGPLQACNGTALLLPVVTSTREDVYNEIQIQEILSEINVFYDLCFIVFYWVYFGG